VLSIPPVVRKHLLRILFYPTLIWTILLHNMMPEKRRWYDRVDPKVIIGALPLKRHLETLARIERVTGIINFCDEFSGHAEYERHGLRQLRLPTLDYCAPTTQQLETGIDFIKRQPPGATVYVHCKAGRGRAGTMLMAYLIDQGLSPAEAQKALSAVRPHVSPRLWKRRSVREFHRRHVQRALVRAQQEAAAAQQQQQQPMAPPQQHD
jgi:atypical dual specificity phosphatase